MNVRIMHGSINITSHVIRYDREHKICNGIGMIELEVDYAYGSNFDPWDLIDLYENGKHAAKYYVSRVEEGQPSATVVVTAQDGSKRLSDYFIPDSYLIDYPSYTKYWISLFLTEAGVSYQYRTDEPGALLSNNTSLGMTSAYENIMMLLQMSGWYITFNASGKAIIGKLITAGSSSGGSYSNSDIIEIKVSKNDRMYRNRVVVWGAGDAASERWVFADISKPTKWDYDSKDKRTILISNSGIPTVSAAFMLANQALMEFARLNIEKYITVEDARDIQVGDSVYIKNKVFTGKGLVTTFGTSMSRSGLVSNITLDERCPRLFGYYNPGGYVYVGTFGNGVWRKHIMNFSGAVIASGEAVPSGFASGVVPSGWEDYSSGIQDLRVTDLHVNAGVLASVTATGQLYYALEDETLFSGIVIGQIWSGIQLSGFQIEYSGTMVDPTVYSGLMGRACIIDRDTNYLRYAIDNRSGENLGDFLMETEAVYGSGFVFAYSNPSGLFASGILVENRSWVLDVNPFDGEVSGVYPVWISGIAVPSGLAIIGSASGTYNVSVYDIENDGTHDYVEAMTILSGYMPGDFYNSEYGVEAGTPFSLGLDDRYNVFIPYSGIPFPVEQTFNYEFLGASYNAFATWDDTGTGGNAYLAYPATNGISNWTAVVVKITLSPDKLSVTTEQFTKLTSISPPNTGIQLGILRTSTNDYDFFFKDGAVIKKCSYRLSSNSITTTTLCAWPASSTGIVLIRKNIINILDTVEETNGFKTYLYKLNMLTGIYTQSVVASQIGTGYGDGQHIFVANGGSLVPYGYDTGVATQIMYVKRTYHIVGIDTFMEQQLYRIYSVDGGSIKNGFVYDWSAVYGWYTDVGYESLGGSIGALDSFHPYYVYYYVYTDFPYFGQINENWWEKDKWDTFALYDRVYTLNADVGYGIARLQADGTFVKISLVNGSILENIPDPPGYWLWTFDGLDTYSKDLYFKSALASRPINSVETKKLVSLDHTTFGVTKISACASSGPGELMFGNFRQTSRALGGGSLIWFAVPKPIPGYFPMYMVLQRDGWDYHVVKSGIYQDRLDISNYSPLVTMGREISSLETYFISSDNTVLQTTQTSISGYNLGSTQMSGELFVLGVEADDMRYSDFEDTEESGTSRKLLVAYSGNLGATDIYAGGVFSGVVLAPSGYINRLEASNYYLPDQYVFISVSGYTAGNGEWGFYQKNPSTISGVPIGDTFSGMFIDCSSGYPQARTTIIRLDDRL